jgi:hypothetical protein
MFNVDDSKKRLGYIETALKDLKDDLNYTYDGNTLAYAVDFTEIFAYVNPSPQKAHQISSSIGIDFEEASRQHLLTLHHLFYSFDINDTPNNKKLYLLPPYVNELLAFAKKAAEAVRKAPATREAASKMLSGLSERNRRFLLESINAGSELDSRRKSKLVEIVKGDFKTICADVTKLIVFKEQSNRWDILVKNGVLDLDIDDFLTKKKLPLLTSVDYIDSDAIDKILDKFDPDLLEEKYFQKRHDAEALTLLGSINNYLTKSKAKMLLLTRDESIFNAVKELDKSSEEHTYIAEFIRRPETIFFDLILVGCDRKEKEAWLDESINHIGELKSEVDGLIETWRRREQDDFGKAQYLVHRRVLLSALIQKVFHSWNQRINLQLSNSAEKIPWISKIKDVESKDFKNESKTDIDTIASVKRVFNFVESEEYGEIAIEEAKHVFIDLILYLKRVLFMKELREATSKTEPQFPKVDVGTVEDEDKNLLLPPVSSKLPFLEFKSDTYRKLFRDFKGAISNKATSYSDALNPLLEATVKGPVEPEDLLFMAFILCVVERWESALSMLEEAGANYRNSDLDFDQVEFFTAYIEGIKAENGENLFEKIEGLNKACSLLSNVIARNSGDPRYLKVFSGIMLKYLDLKLHLDELNEEKAIEAVEKAMKEQGISIAKAKKHLKKAWEIQQLKDSLPDDLRMRVEILNNLLFIEVVADKPDYQEAYKWRTKMDTEFKRLSMKHSRAAEAIEPYLDDTKMMMRARKAKEESDVATLEKCIDEISATETMRNRIAILQEWRKEI